MIAGAEFELQRIPPLFARAYRKHLLSWAKSGQQYAIIHLWEFPDALKGDPRWQGDVRLEVEMWAPHDGSEPKIVLKPATPEDADRIAAHCALLPTIGQAHKLWDGWQRAMVMERQNA